MALGFWRTSALIPSEEGISSVSGKNSRSLSSSPRRIDVLQEVDIGARVGLAREEHDRPVVAAHLGQLVIWPV
jgi:hypothetical protein